MTETSHVTETSHRVPGTVAIPNGTLEKRLGVSRGCPEDRAVRLTTPSPSATRWERLGVSRGCPEDRAVRLITPSPRKDYR